MPFSEYPKVATPYPRQSTGLSDAYTDILGGDYLQDNVAGDQSNLNFNGQQAQFTVVVGGSVSSWDISTSAYSGKSTSVTAQDATPNGIAFSADGTKMYMLGGVNKTVFEYVLSVAYDVSTAAYASKSFSVSAQAANPLGLAFSANGLNIYVTDQATSTVYEYGMTVAWDVSTASYTGKFLSTATQDGKPHGLSFDSTGKILYVAGYSNDTIYQYTLSIAYDVSTATYSGKSLHTAGTSDTPGWIAFKPDGTTVMFTGAYSHIGMSYEWTLGTAWDISTGSSSSAISFSLATQDATPTGFAVSPDGVHFYAAGTTTHAVYEYNFNFVAGKQIIIPAAWFGGNITWVRGLFALSAVPRYAAFMADFSSGDATNYADFTQVATNNYSGGVLSTAIPVLPSVVTGTVLQAYFSYRTPTQSASGQAMSGYPMLHLDPYQGTANDGDNYLMMALYHAYKTVGNQAYKTLADRIGAALLAVGNVSSNNLTFALPFAEEAGQYGIYWYNAPATPFSIAVVPRPDGSPGNCLEVAATVASGLYAGFGAWPTFPVTGASPFNSLDFTLYGDGSARNLQVSTTVDAGAVSALVPLMPAWANAFHSYSLPQTAFWKTANVVYDSLHSDYQFKGSYGSNVNTLVPFVDTVNNKITWEFDWNFVGNSIGYAGYYFGAASGSSLGTTAFNFDFYSLVAGVVTFTAKDANGIKYPCNLTVAAGWNYGLSIPWLGALNVGFSQTTFAHPVYEFYVDAPSTMTSGAFRVDNARYDAVVSMASAPITGLQGFQFAYPSNAGGAYTTYFGNININQVLVDGTPADPQRYAGIPRFTYKWMMSGNSIGYGTWRGCTAMGYLWSSGWQQSGIVNPVNSRLMSDQILNMFTDSQNAYHTQFPTKQIGPFMPRYGRVSWEALNTGGYVAGALVSNTVNQWYFPSTDDWYGYMVRALLSVARCYYLTRSAPAKAILDNWMAWLDVNIIADGAYWWPPSDYYNNGTAGYTYKPVYAYATIAAACIYKYWVDGDPLALKWYRRLLDDIFARQRQTATGTLAGIYPTAEGTGYTTATVVFTVNGGATAPTATPFIAGGKITHYTVATPGAGITSISATITGDGSAATGNAYLSDDLVGAFSTSHAGWEAAEIYNTYGLLVNGPPAGGAATYPITIGPNDLAAFTGMAAFYQRTTRANRPSMLNANEIPFHEYCVDPYHNGAAIENPMISDTHVKGAMWTETIGPTVYMAVEYGRYTGDYSWLERLYNLVYEYTN